MPEDFLIISPQLAIGSMRYSGYKDAAYAVAELIDNSIQAGENTGKPVGVQVICLEKENIGDRKNKQISHIAVYDDASGMSKDTLRKALQFGGGTRRNAVAGMGKFGMGLPNASISQCNKVDVYSWQGNKCYHTHLDIQEVESGICREVPEPTTSEIPSIWREKIEYDKNIKIGSSGTLVIWSSLERMKWKRHKAFFDNTEFLIGRIYRHFINNKESSIRLAAYTDSRLETSRFVKPNDPLYLMSGTNAPEEFSEKSAFTEYMDKPFEKSIKFNGEEYKITIRASVASKETREIAHHQKHPLSNHCKRNTGISLVRANRELELNTSFVQINQTERWWGIEVAFPPGLDEVFGVTNNKQAATKFNRLTKEDVSLEEGLSESETMNLLEQADDPIRHIVEITNDIDRMLNGLRKIVEERKVSQKKNVDSDTANTQAEDAANKIAEIRKEEGKIGKSDIKEESQSEDEKKKELETTVDSMSITSEEKDQTLLEYLQKGKFLFSYSNTITPAWGIVDFTPPAGKLKVTINTTHPAWENIEDVLELIDSEQATKIRDSVTLLFAALAKAEDEISDLKFREKVEELRFEWGRIARDMIRTYNGEE